MILIVKESRLAVAAPRQIAAVKSGAQSAGKVINARIRNFDGKTLVVGGWGNVADGVGGNRRVSGSPAP